jgi:RIO kinase 1
MTGPLELLLAEGVIDEVLSRLKGGKEADVWLVRHGGEIVAAKVYRARSSRSFKNDAAYKDGRQVRNSRTQRAMDRGSRFGRAAAEDAWKSNEADALFKLHAASLRVPRPVLFYEGVLLMEVVLDAQGQPAPRLIDAPIGLEQAAHLYAVLRAQAVGMLSQDLIHGDLSPFNVLFAADGPVVIDFPQVVGAAHNSQAEMFFLRDLRNIHQFFAQIDPALRSAEGDGREIWRAYLRRELTADFVPTGRSSEPPRPSGDRRPPRTPQVGPSAKHPAPRTHPDRPHVEHAVDARPRAGNGLPGGGHPRDSKPAQGGERAQRGRGGERPQRGQGGEHAQRSQGGEHAQRGQGGEHAQRGQGGQQRGRDPRRDRPMPEVIRIERPLRHPPGPGGRAPEAGTSGHESASGGVKGENRPGGQEPGGHRRRRRRRRG